MAKSPYPFTRDFTALVCLAECSIRRFHEIVGHAVDPDRIIDDDARLLFSSAVTVAERNNGCAEPDAVMQHIRMIVHDGKCTMEEWGAANDLLDYAEDSLGGIKDLDTLIGQLVPIVKDFAQQEATDASIADISRKKGPEASIERFSWVDGIGKKRRVPSEELDGSEEDIQNSADTLIRDPLPTGIYEIDVQIDGGLERSALGFFLSSESAAGKTFALCGISVEAMIKGLDVVYVTLEMLPRQIKNRVYRNLLDFDQHDLTTRAAEGNKRWQAWKAAGLGRFDVKYMSPAATTVKEIGNYIREVESEKKLNPQVIIVDYADKLVPKVRPKSGEKWGGMEEIYDALRDMAIERDGYCWTASQGTRDAVGKKKVTQKECATSIEKVRSADLIIGISRTDTDRQNGDIRFNIPKRRAGANATSDVGPLHVDWDHGRMTMISRDNPWDTQ